MFCIRGCLIHDLPYISTEYLRNLGDVRVWTLRGKINSDKMKITPYFMTALLTPPRSLPMDNQGYQGKPIGRSG